MRLRNLFPAIYQTLSRLSDGARKRSATSAPKDPTAALTKAPAVVRIRE
jgi:hypothetical protein